MATRSKAGSGFFEIAKTIAYAVFRWARRMAIVAMFAVSLLSVGITAAMTVSSTVFDLISSLVESVYDGATVRRHQNTELAKVRKQLDDEMASSKRLRRDLAKTTVERDRVKRELAERTVNYRGSKRLAREAVADTSERVARRVAAAATRTVASTAGEALPLFGVGVIAAATAYELYDACEMMKELHALDVAFNPESAIAEREVCGMQAPTQTEIWAAVKASPSAAWSTAADYYHSLGEVDVGAMFGSGYKWILGWNPWADLAAPQLETGPPLSDEHAGAAEPARP